MTTSPLYFDEYNVARISEELAKTILTEAAELMTPGSLELARWASDAAGGEANGEDMAEPACGTPACIAGHISYVARLHGVYPNCPPWDIVPVTAAIVAHSAGVVPQKIGSYNVFGSRVATWPSYYADAVTETELPWDEAVEVIGKQMLLDMAHGTFNDRLTEWELS